MECKKDQIKYFTLTGKGGTKVVLSNLGAGIISITVPDKNGVLDNVSLCYADPESYFADGPCLGKVPGRFANRIAFGKFSIDGKEYTLSTNTGRHHLHGGPGSESYANRIWDAEQDSEGVTFTLSSPDGDAGYPGALKATARYTWSDDCCLTLTLTAESDATTIINLTNHAYFDLEGLSSDHGQGIRKHQLQMFASHYLPLDDDLITTGEFAPVAGTVMDFTSPKEIGQDLFADCKAIKIGKGYDTCFVIDGEQDAVRPAACLEAPTSGRRLTVSSNQPGMQIYTGNWLEGCPAGPDGRQYHDYDGVAMECQQLPDGPNKPQFNYRHLHKGETYTNIIKWQFDTI